MAQRGNFELLRACEEKRMIVQNNNTLTIRDLAKNRVFTMVKRGDKVIISFTDEFGEKFSVATLDATEIQQVIMLLLG